MATCKVCGAPHRSCGPSTTVIPVDERVTSRKKDLMSLQRYTISTGRRGEHTTVVKLTEAEAKRLGAIPVDGDEKKSTTPSNKARTPSNKGGQPKKSATKPAPPANPVNKAETKPDASDGASDPGASDV